MACDLWITLSRNKKRKGDNHAQEKPDRRQQPVVQLQFKIKFNKSTFALICIGTTTENTTSGVFTEFLRLVFLKNLRFRFLLSENISKECIVIVKKFDFEVFPYLYVLRSPEFIYAICEVMYVCICECVCVCE